MRFDLQTPPKTVLMTTGTDIQDTTATQGIGSTNRVRWYLYLIVGHPNDDHVGRVRAANKKYDQPEKNEEASIQRKDLATGDTYVEQVVGLGYYDFETRRKSVERYTEVAQEKLGEVDESHLRKAGLDSEEVHER